MYELFLNIIHWTLIYDPDDAKTKERMFHTYAIHLFPLICVIGDWFLNRIYFEKNQIWFDIIVLVLYLYINHEVTKSTGKPVYSIMSWDTKQSWFFALSMFPSVLLLEVIIYYLTYAKFKCLKMDENKKTDIESPLMQNNVN